MKLVIESSFWKIVCLILIIASCTGKDKTTNSGDKVVGSDSVNYNDPLQRDSAHVDSSFRNGLGH